MFNMQGNNGFNNSNNVSVNTRLYSSFSDTCNLTLGAWNEQLSLKFAPFKGVNGEGIRQYATDKADCITTSLTVDNAITLVNGVKKTIFPALENETPAEVSVTMGNGENRKALKLSTDGKAVTITIYLGVSEDGVSTGDSISHMFNTREYMTSYDPSSGANTSTVVNADFENFITKVENIQMLSQVVPHAIKFSNSLKGSNNGGYKNNSGYNNFNTTSQNVQSSSYNGFEDFMPGN